MRLAAEGVTFCDRAEKLGSVFDRAAAAAAAGASGGGKKGQKVATSLSRKLFQEEMDKEVGVNIWVEHKFNAYVGSNAYLTHTLQVRLLG